MNQDLPSSSPQLSSDLAGEKRGGRTGDSDLGSLGVQQPSDKPFPVANKLNFVEMPDDRSAAIEIRESPKVLVHKQAELVSADSGQPLVLEGDVRRSSQRHAAFDGLAAQLMQESGLPGPAHPDHGSDLARETHGRRDAPGSEAR